MDYSIYKHLILNVNKGLYFKNHKFKDIIISNLNLSM
jgi:hypothetical protein